MDTNKKIKSKFSRIRFLASTILSSPAVVFVYSPLLIALTIAGIAVPFATGRFIDALVGGMPPLAPFATLAALLFVRAIMTPCLQRFILSRSRNIELLLQEMTICAVLDFSRQSYRRSTREHSSQNLRAIRMPSAAS